MRKPLSLVMVLGLVGCAGQPSEDAPEAVMEEISSGKADEGFHVQPDQQYSLKVDTIAVDPAQIDFDLSQYNVRATVDGASSGSCPASQPCDFTSNDDGRLTRDGSDAFDGSELELAPVRLDFEPKSEAQQVASFVKSFGTVRISDTSTVRFKVSLHSASITFRLGF